MFTGMHQTNNCLTSMALSFERKGDRGPKKGSAPRRRVSPPSHASVPRPQHGTQVPAGSHQLFVLLSLSRPLGLELLVPLCRLRLPAPDLLCVLFLLLLPPLLLLL